MTDDELLDKIRARRRAAGEPPAIEIPAGIRASLKVWLNKHTNCGGKHITYVGEHEFRIGCTCGDKGD